MPLTSFTELLPAVAKYASNVSFAWVSEYWLWSVTSDTIHVGGRVCICSHFLSPAEVFIWACHIIWSCPSDTHIFVTSPPGLVSACSTGMATVHPAIAVAIAGTEGDQTVGLAIGTAIYTEWMRALASCLSWQSTLLTHRQHGFIKGKSYAFRKKREELHTWVQDILC